MKPLSWNEYVRLALSYAAFSTNEDGSWTVEVPVLPGCVTWGTTRSEAALMAEDAIQGWLVTALRFGDEIPLIDGYGLVYLDDSSASSIISYAQADS
jgi:predicted RNase H-like HicB family nuclease